MNRYKPTKNIVCSLCSQPFVFRVYREIICGPKTPRVLKCGHTACEGCLTKILTTQQKIICTCGKVSLYSEDSQEKILETEFPMDFYTIGLQTYITGGSKTSDCEIRFKTAASASEVKPTIASVICHECRNCNADCTCLQCNVHYCTTCFNKIHQLARAFMDHKMTPLQHLEGAFDIHCPSHPKQQVEFFCNDCTVSVCSGCLIACHNGHKIELLSDKNKAAMNELVDSHVKVCNLLTRLKSTRKKIIETAVKGGPSNHLLETEKVVCEHFSQIHGYLTIKQNELVTAIFEPYQESQRKIKKLLDHLDEEIKKLNQVLSISDRLLKASPKYVSSVNYNEVLSNLKEKENIPCFFILEKSEELFRFTADQSIFQSIENHCNLGQWGPELRESHCRLVGEEELPADYKIEPINEITKDVLITPNDFSYSRANSSTSLSSYGSNDEPQNSQLSEFHEGEIYSALLCHMNSPSDFYIHTSEVSVVLSNLNFQFSRLSSLKKYPPIHVLKGRIYLVKYGQHNKWHRGRVMNIKGNDEIYIHYIDYGNEEIVNKDRLRTIPLNFLNIGNLATHCRVHKCVPANGATWSPEAISFMAQLPKNGDISIIVKKIHQNIIDVDVLQHINNGVMSLQESLLFLGLAVLTDSCDTVMITRKPVKTYQQPLVWKEGEIINCRVTFIKSLSHFYVCDVDTSLKTYVVLKDELMKFYTSHMHCKALQVYNPYPDMPVAVNLVSNQWCRAIILEVTAPKIVKVFLVDNGNEEIISWDKIMNLIPNFLHYPPLVHRCSLSGVVPVKGEEWNKEAISAFRSMTSDVILKLVVDSADGDMAKVVLFTCQSNENKCINTVIIENNLAKNCCINSIKTNVDLGFLNDTKERNVELLPIMKTNHVKERSSDIVSLSFAIQNPQLDVSNPHFDNDNDSFRMKVTMKRIVSPDEFYVEPTLMASQLKVLKEKMDIFYNKEEDVGHKENKWKEEDICAVNIQVDNYYWHRAFILKINEDSTAMIKLLDEGQEVIVSLLKLYPLDDQFRKLMEGTIRCHLVGLKSPMSHTSWPYTTTAEFEELAQNNSDQLYMTKMGDIRDRSLPIELFIRCVVPAGPLDATKSEWDSINNRLRLGGYAIDDGTKEWTVDGVQNSPKAEHLNDKIKTKEEESGGVMHNLPTKWIPAEPFGSLEFLANVSYVDNNADVYIQDVQHSILTLKTINEKLNYQNEGTDPSCLSMLWNPGQVCLVKYHLDQKWYRGVVEKINGNEISVRFVDYGNIEECDSSDLRAITMMSEIPIQCQPCCFYNIVPTTPDGKWTIKLLDYIHTSLVDHQCHISLCILPNEEGYSYGIQSLKLPTGKDFILKLVEEGHVKFIEMKDTAYAVSDLEDDQSQEVIIESDKVIIYSQSQDSSEECEIECLEKILYWLDIINRYSGSLQNCKSNYKNIEIPVDVDNLNVEMTAILSATKILMTIESSNHVILDEMKQQFDELMKIMQEEAPSQPVLEKPYLYQACCVKYSEDEKWYRGIVLQDCDDRLLVQYVDYGNVEMILVQDVHQLKQEWCSVAVQAVMCILNNVKLVNKDQHKKTIELLSSSLHSQPLRARIKRRAKGNLYVDLYNGDQLAYQDLIDEKFFEFISSTK